MCLPPMKCVSSRTIKSLLSSLVDAGPGTRRARPSQGHRGAGRTGGLACFPILADNTDRAPRPVAACAGGLAANI